MRIGVDASCWLNRRGFGRYARELVRALLDVDRDNGYVLFLDADTARHSEGLPPEDRATRVIVPTDAAAARAASADGRRSLSDLWRMRRAVAQWGRRLDVVYFPAVYTYFPVRTPARVVVTKHDMTDRRCPELLFPTWRSRLFWELKVRAAIRRADLVFTVSQTSRRDILDAFRLAPECVRVVSDAVDAQFKPEPSTPVSQAVLRRHGVAADDRFVLYVGGISPHKNLETLVAAYGRWRAADPSRAAVKLVLVGDFAADVFYSSYPGLSTLVRTAGLERDVRFTGFVPDRDLIHFYGAADVLVLPSLSEGFGLPVLEAMACGAPVIVSDAGALPEVAGEAGLLFPPRSVDALAAALGRVLGDADLRRGMRERGLARAAQFTWEASARVALAAFRELAG